MPGDDSAYIVCVADNPRIHYCGDNSLFDPQTLSCLNYEVGLFLSQCMIITYLKTGERDDIENCCLRAEGPKATIFNVFSFPCFEVRGNSIVS